MKIAHQPIGKISAHFEGMGTVTGDMVIQRARELALINGRPPNHYSLEDVREAKRELTGLDCNGNELAGEEPIAGLTCWDENPGTLGHEVETTAAADEQTIAERLVESGANEAEHELMVEGAKSPENQE